MNKLKNNKIIYFKLKINHNTKELKECDKITFFKNIFINLIGKKYIKFDCEILDKINLDLNNLFICKFNNIKL